MRKLLAGIVIGAVLAACGTAVAKNGDPTGYFNEKTGDDMVDHIGWHEVRTPEGKVLQCVWADNGVVRGSGGLSCNWERYNKPQ